MVIKDFRVLTEISERDEKPSDDKNEYKKSTLLPKTEGERVISSYNELSLSTNLSRAIVIPFLNLKGFIHFPLRC